MFGPLMLAGAGSQPSTPLKNTGGSMILERYSSEQSEFSLRVRKGRLTWKRYDVAPIDAGNRESGICTMGADKGYDQKEFVIGSQWLVGGEGRI